MRAVGTPKLFSYFSWYTWIARVFRCKPSQITVIVLATCGPSFKLYSYLVASHLRHLHSGRPIGNLYFCEVVTCKARDLNRLRIFVTHVIHNRICIPMSCSLIYWYAQFKVQLAGSNYRVVTPEVIFLRNSRICSRYLFCARPEERHRSAHAECNTIPGLVAFVTQISNT